MTAWITISAGKAVGLLSALVFLANVCVLFHILKRPRDARTSLLWIFFVFTFPLIGLTAYLLFGINTVPRKSWDKHYSDALFAKRQESEKGHSPLAETYARRDALRHDADRTGDPALHRLLDRIAPGHLLLDGNAIDLLTPADHALEAMFEAIRQARHHIHLTTYILADDCVGRRLMTNLVRRAKAGVQVRVLYDAFGSAGPEFRGFFRRYRKIPNLQIIPFSHSNIFKRQLQLNLRNHRKLLIIDGTTAFTGGINFHDVYLTGDSGKRGAGVSDLHFRIRGPIVLDLQYTFLRDWFYMTECPLTPFISADYYPPTAACGTVAARLVNSGPQLQTASAVTNLFFALITRATRQLILATPYFVPSQPLMLALCQAARRGVEVKVLVPRKNNHPTIRIASQALYQPLLSAGVTLFERHPPFMHTKATVIDDHISVIGSANLDPRSLDFNYETDLVVESEPFAQTLKAALADDFARSDVITYGHWRRRSKFHQLIENFFNLFHPIA